MPRMVDSPFFFSFPRTRNGTLHTHLTITMFNIPELDEMVCRKLKRQDLTQCLRVCKKWHQALLPFLWRDLTCIRCISEGKKEAFRQMVKDDYLQERELRRKQKDDKRNTEQSTQKESSPVLSNLAQHYGPRVLVLPVPMDMLRILEPPEPPSKKGRSKEPTAIELLRHIYKHCPAIQLPQVTFTHAKEVSDDVLKTIAEFLVPRTRSVHISSRERIESWRLKCLLSQCLSKLEQLSLKADVSCIEKGRNGGFDGENWNWKPWSSFKELDLRRCRGSSGPISFWAWLWKRCGYVEILKVGSVGQIAKSLAEGMRDHMPKLREIHLGSKIEDSNGLKDDGAAAILSGCRKGWKVVKIGYSVEFKTSAKEALAKHFSTLEELVMAGQHLKGSDVVWALASASNLRSLIALRDGSFLAHKYPDLKAHEFIDLRPTTESLRTWACEKSLRVLKITIKDIPRPDLGEQSVVKETYHGQGREIQGRVYDRLARFTNLETLWLGSFLGQGTGDRQRLGSQKDCLEMSLESGLHKLAGLKLLKELDVTQLATRIGLKEVQWMAGHWPKLKTIRGFESVEKQEVETWIHECHPYISLECKASSSRP
ncbi:MAG: hypothetical protein J3Q66DRAFT_56106 [Benniella sp.]|nr:MAG: hypothetical protein J3Q66DRAFT_56106 [Benniella sp.]